VEDCHVSDKEYKLILDEVEKYRTMKEEIRHKHTLKAGGMIDEETKTGDQAWSRAGPCLFCGNDKKSLPRQSLHLSELCVHAVIITVSRYAITYCELLRDTDCFLVSLHEHELKCMPVAKTTAYRLRVCYCYDSKQHSAKITIIIRYL